MANEGIDLMDQQKLKSVLHYSPESGVFTWVIPPKGKSAGSVAGSKCNGYIRIQMDGVNYAAHRLAWLYMNGSFPESEIDHMDRDRSNNKWENIRQATRSENCANKNHAIGGSGYRGVHLIKKTGKYAASIVIGGLRKRIGTFDTAIAASDAYKKEAKLAFGEFYS